MATRIEKITTLPTFKEDAREWTRKAAFIIQLQEIDERKAKQAIGTALEGKAFD